MHDLVVLSDLHLGRGKNPETGRHHQLEAFFYDDDLAQFCRWICRQADERKTDLRLVLNGDVFDLLRIEPAPTRDSAKRGRRSAPVMSPETAVETVRMILDGHPGFVRGIAHVLEHGHEVILLPGNHDLETQWPEVQQVVRDSIHDHIADGNDEATAETAVRGLSFSPWFHYEPGRIWIEHGCQYDPENSFEYQLRSSMSAQPDVLREAEQDVPLGTFFQRYLYNGFGNITFIVPSSRANLRYFRWLLLNKPRLLARVATSHFPFFWQVIRRIAKAGGSERKLRALHEAELAELAETSGLGADLERIESLKIIHGSGAQMARGVISQILKFISVAILLALLVAGLWFAGFHAINQMAGGVGLKAGLFILLNFLFLTTVTFVVAYLLLRPPRAPPSRPMRKAATEISRLLDVPVITFGHSHDEVIWRLERGPDARAWYYNTGTWVAIFTYDELLPRERVQYTFLYVRGHEAELLQWSPGRDEAIPVVLLEEDDPLRDPARPTGPRAS